MPIYEYECNECRERQEIIQSFSDPPLTDCAKCGGSMKKLFSSPAIQFRGSGFYKTDYASSSSKSNAGNKSSGDAAGSGGPDASTGSKPDSKTESKSEPKSDSSS